MLLHAFDTLNEIINFELTIIFFGLCVKLYIIYGHLMLWATRPAGHNAFSETNVK